MSDWHLGPMMAFDLETTSPDPDEARIVTATICRIHGGDVQSREWLVNPGVEIPQGAIDIHGVTNEQAQAEGIDPAVAAAQIFAELDAAWTGGGPVVIYNASYDLTVLDRELRRHCGTELGEVGPVIDPYTIDKHLDKYRRGSRTLTATCEHYNVRLDAAHDAKQDALAAGRLAWRLANVYPQQLGDLGNVNLLQAMWRAEWAVGFREFLERKGTPEPVDGHWPVRPLAVAS